MADYHELITGLPHVDLATRAGWARQIFDLRLRLDAPIPHGIPARSLEKTLILGHWRAPHGGADHETEILLTAEILGAFDVLLFEQPDYSAEFWEDLLLAAGPSWQKVELVQEPSDLVRAGRDRTHANGRRYNERRHWAFLLDQRKAQFTGQVGTHSVDVRASGRLFRFFADAPILLPPDEPASCVLLNISLEPEQRSALALGGFLVPEELDNEIQGIALRPRARDVQLLAAGRFVPPAPFDTIVIWTALEIDFRHEKLHNFLSEAEAQLALEARLAEEARLRAASPANPEPDAPLLDQASARPPFWRGLRLGIEAEASDFWDACKALFIGRN